MLRRYFFFTLLLLLTSLINLQGQVTISIPDNIVQPDEEIVVPISVDGFLNMVGMQFTIKWDSSVLEYSDVGGFNLEGLGSTNFGPPDPVDRLTVSWFTFVIGGISAPDGTTLFEITFKTVGQHSDTTSIDIDEVMPVEFIDSNYQPLDVTVDKGFVQVDDPNSTYHKLNTPLAQLQPAFPNPFAKNVSFPVLLKEPRELNLRIFDRFGREIYFLKNVYPSGAHLLTLDRKHFSGEGIYFYSIQIDENIFSDRLFFIQ